MSDGNEPSVSTRLFGRRDAFRAMSTTMATLLVSSALDPLEGWARSPQTPQRKMMVAMAPLAVAAAVFSIASSLKSLFGSRESNRAIKQRLDQIIAQNQQILQTLGEIVVILNNLGVTVRENVRFELIFDKQTGLIGESRQLFEAWSAELLDPGARRQVAERYRLDILPDVRDLTRQLMDPGYGFTAADTVGNGMMMEFWMSWRLGERRAYRREIGDTYLGYFDRALDASANGTPAMALADALAQRDRMKVVLDAADARIGPNGWTAETNRAVRSRTHGRTTDFERYRILETATGNQASGYSSSSREEVLQRWSETEPHECTHCFMAEDPSAELSPRDPRDTSGASPTGRVTYWNAVRTTYLASLADVELLTRVNDTLRFYHEQADALRISG